MFTLSKLINLVNFHSFTFTNLNVITGKFNQIFKYEINRT